MTSDKTAEKENVTKRGSWVITTTASVQRHQRRHPWLAVCLYLWSESAQPLRIVIKMILEKAMTERLQTNNRLLGVCSCYRVPAAPKYRRLQFGRVSIQRGGHDVPRDQEHRQYDCTCSCDQENYPHKWRVWFGVERPYP
jgi:hypothetical protein